jgi:hypothetical protein
MLKRLASLTIVFVIIPTLYGGTYYVSPAGSDSNPGTQSNPWLTIQNAANIATAGDTVLVQPGIYKNATYAYPQNNGTSNAPIVFRANGPVTNQFGFYVGRNYITIDGFTFTGYSDANAAAWLYTASVFIGNAANYCTVTNCAVIGTSGNGANEPSQTGIGMNASAPYTPAAQQQGCRFVNNVFDGIIGSTVINTHGANYFIEGNIISNIRQGQGIRPHGSNIVIRLNTFTNIYDDATVTGGPPHTDVVQCFGDNGFYASQLVFERNLVVNCPVQLLQATADYNTSPLTTNYGSTNMSKWGLTFANNVFMNSTMQSSIDVPNVQFYNNTFYRCATDSGVLLSFGFFDVTYATNVNWRGAATNSVVRNNAFVECGTGKNSGWYAGTYMAFNGTNWNAQYTSIPSWVKLDADYNFVCGPNGAPKTEFSEQHGINGGQVSFVNPVWGDVHQSNGSILIDNGQAVPGVAVDKDGAVRPQGAAYDIGAYEYGGPSQGTPPTIATQPQGLSVTAGAAATFSVVALGSGPLAFQWRLNGLNIPGATGASYTDTSAQTTDSGNYTVVVTNAFGSTASSVATLTVQGISLISPSIISQPESVTTNAGASVSFSVVATGTAPMAYQWSHNGTNISGGTSSTYSKPNAQMGDAGSYGVQISNVAGTLGSSNAVLTFTTSSTSVPDPSLVLRFDFDENLSTGHVADSSGNGNDGWEFDPTNRVTACHGVFGSMGAQFTYVGTITNDYPNVYPLSQYIAITNLNGFASLTKGTISLWAQFDTNGDLAMRLLDTGYTAGYASVPSSASNSWALCRDSSPYLNFLVYPAGAGKQRLLSWPNDVDRNTLSSSNLHLYSVTIDCPGNRAIAYYDGQPYMTNAINLPWIRIYGGAVQPWLCIGAMSHDGTPQWGDDKYPNSGFFNGKMDDIRIYNRTLSAAEIQNLYNGTQVVARVAPPTGLRTVTVVP